MALVATRPTPQLRPVLSLTAAASERKLGGFITGQISQEGWQTRMWEFYRSLGAVHYGVNFKRNAAAKVSYFAAEKTDWDPEPTENQQVIEALARLQSRFGDINEIVAELMIHVNVPGEGYLIGEEGLDGEEWDIWSVAEVNAAQNAVMPKPDQAVFDSNAFLCRIWRPDPESRHLADSPLRPVSDQCEQLLLLDDSIAAAAKSRLSAGLLLVPNELDIGDQNAFEDKLIAILTTGIKVTDAASRWSPGLIRGPAELLKEMRLMSFAREIDATFADMREELTRSIAAGLDLPAEIVTGKGDLSHWNAWEIDESAFRDHIDPDIILILDSITRGYLHPALIEGGMAEEEADKYLIWRDLSDLGQRPPTIPEATGLFDRQLLSGDYMRGLINASDEDKPALEEGSPGGEPLEATGVGINRGAPGQDTTVMGVDTEPIAARINAVGMLIRSGFDPEASLKAMGLPPIAHLGFLPVTIKTDVPPDPAAAVLDPNAPAPAPKRPVAPVPEGLVATARGRPLTELSNIDRRLLDRILEASEAAFNRVLERAGAKIRSHARKDRAISLSIDRLPNDQVTRHLGEKLTAQLQITPAELVPPDSFDPLTKRLRVIMSGAASEVEATLETLTGIRPTLDAPRIQRAIGHYATQLEGFSLKLLFNPLDAGPGEVGDSVVPQGMVMDMMTVASGGKPSEGPSDVRGFATGQESLDFLEKNGYTPTGHLWEYGDSSTRQRPFPPHRRLDGAEFSDWDSEELATPASASFLNVGHMFPGDHYRCQCRTVPVVITPPAADAPGVRPDEPAPIGPSLSWEQFGIKTPTDPTRKRLLDEALLRLNGLDPEVRDRFVSLLGQFDGGVRFNVATASTKAIKEYGRVTSLSRNGSLLEKGRKLSLQLSRQTDEWDEWVEAHNFRHRQIVADPDLSKLHSGPGSYREALDNWLKENPEPARWRLATPDEVADVLVHELGHANDFQQKFDVGQTLGRKMNRDTMTKVHEMYWGGPRGTNNPLNAAYEYAASSSGEAIAELQRFYLRGVHSHGLDLTALEWRTAHPELASWVKENLLP